MKERWSGEAQSAWCPYTGRALKVCALGGGWVAVSEGPGGGWCTSVQTDRVKLLKALGALFPMPTPGEPLQAVDTLCPALKLPVELVETRAGWEGRVCGPDGFGYRTSPFWSRRHLEYFLSTRAGVPPLFGSGDVKVRERTPPPRQDPALEEEAQSRQEVVREAVEKAVFDVAPRGRRVISTGR